MSLQLQIIHIPEGELLAETLCSLPAGGGLIGRATDCALSLPDNTRTVSSRHAHLFQEGEFWLIEDISTNGLYINQSPTPLGPGKRHQLSDGDILTCGQYRIMANLFTPGINPSDHALVLDQNQTGESGNGSDPFANAHREQGPSAALDDPFADPVEQAVQSTHTGSKHHDFDFDSAVRGMQETQLPESDRDSDFPQPDTSELINILEKKHQEVIPRNAAEARHRNDSPVITPVTVASQPPAAANPPAQQPPQPMPPVAYQTTSDNTLLRQLQEENRRLREQLRKRDRLRRKMMTYSIGVALEQTLMDFSPEYLEKLFDDYSTRKNGWFRKRDNWQMYRRHFTRITKEQSARLAFTARFQAAMRKLQESKP